MMEVQKSVKKVSFYYGLGRRKSSVARVRVFLGGTGKVTINDKPADIYVPKDYDRLNLLMPLQVVNQSSSYDITVKVLGGGIKGQIEATRLGIAKALVKVDEGFKTALRKKGLLTTDARVVERKKPGLVKARKAKQYTKR